jgi:DNA polymerase-3 subunit gamma/tau
MSYLVLARKWRPTTFAEVIGQDHVTTTLQKAFEKGRLAHAYLFSGPRGCGKTSTARLLAKIINCENPKDGEPCNECSSCLAVNAGSHLDMIEIDGASNRGIDEIRDLREKIGYASSQSGSKIYIIDEVHMLTQQAFNALLKTLEEPPEHVYLIFATTEPHKVPATILSRCQRFNFKRLELAELSGQLGRICDSEKIAFDADALSLICRRADGSMRDAESLLDQCISASEKKIDLETVRRVLGLVDSQIIASLLFAVSRRDREAALSVVDRTAASGMDLEEFFIAFLEGIRNLLVIAISGKKTDWLDLTQGEIEKLSETASRFAVEDLLFLFRSMSRAYRELRGSSHPRYHIEAALAEAASWESAVEIGALIGGLQQGGGAAETGAGRSTSARGSSAGKQSSEEAGAEAGPGSHVRDEGVIEGENRGSSRGKPDSPPIGEGGGSGGQGILEKPVKENPLLRHLGGREEWERFLAQVRESKLTLGIWLMSADVAGVENDRLILAFSPKNRFAMGMIEEIKNKRLIENHLEKFYGRKFTVETCENVDLGEGGICDPQAELEIIVKTGPGSIQAGDGEVDMEPSRSGAELNGNERKKSGSGRPGKKTDDPALERIIDKLDAELLD